MRNFPAQYNLQDTDVLYFSHIPKTAGMTFRTIVEDHFHLDEICPATLNAQVAKIPSDALAKYRLFRGHLGFINIPELVPGKQVVNVTFLREPVARVISHYEYIRRMPNDPHYPAVINMTLEEFSQKLTAGKVGKNIQTYHVAKAARFDLDDLSPDDILSLAKDSLDQFAFVGLVERFQDSLFLLSYIFGWKPILNSRSENVARKKKAVDELPASTLAVLQESTRLDQELYDYAKQIFEQRFDQMQADLQQYGDSPGSGSGQLFDQIAKNYEKRYASLHRPASTSFVYDFVQPLIGYGWQRRECPPEGPPAYRWTGPDVVSTLDFPVTQTPTDLLVEARVISTQATAADIVESLTLAVNGQAVPLVVLHGDRGVRLLQGVIPRTLVGASDKGGSDRPFTELTFRVNRVTSLNTVNPSDPDTRSVGLAFNLVQVYPIALERDRSASLELFENPAWNATADFLHRHLRDEEMVVAPLAFRAKLSNRVDDYDLFLQKGGFEWVVLHKGWTAQINALLITLLKQGYRPVFANDVFVIFTRRRDVQSISYLSADVKPVYVDRIKRTTEQWMKTGYRWIKGSRLGPQS